MLHSVLSTGLPILASWRRNSNALARCELPTASPRDDAQRRVVAPAVGIADLVGDRRAASSIACFFGRVGHPRRASRCRAPAPTRDRGPSAACRPLAYGPKVSLTNAWPSDSPRSRVGVLDASPPSWRQLRSRPAASSRRTRKFSSTNADDSNGRVGTNQLPAQVGLDVVQRRCRQQRTERLEEVRLGDVDRLERRRADATGRYAGQSKDGVRAWARLASSIGGRPSTDPVAARCRAPASPAPPPRASRSAPLRPGGRSWRQGAQ